MNTKAKANHAKVLNLLNAAIRRSAPIETIRALQDLATFWASRCIG